LSATLTGLEEKEELSYEEKRELEKIPDIDQFKGIKLQLKRVNGS
jgi:hypothetical protein